MVEDVVPIILSWLEISGNGSHSFLETFGLIKFFAESKSESAFLIFEKVITPAPNPLNEAGNIFYRAAISIFPLTEHFQGKVLDLKAVVSTLQELNVEKTISILENQLCEVLRLEAEHFVDKE